MFRSLALGLGTELSIMLLKQVAKVPSAIADDKRRGYWRTNGLATRVQNEYAITLHSQLDADIELAESTDYSFPSLTEPSSLYL